jgi:Ca2+-binding RTX toxin-like protein
MQLNRADLEFILQQIKIAEAHAAGADLRSLIPDPASPLGLRTVDGSFNNLANPTFGAADQVFPRMTTPVFRDADEGTSFAQTQGDVIDAQPRIISNLIADQTSGNPAAVAAAGNAASESSGTLPMPNVSPIEEGAAGFNSLFTFFGQFFDHGLDLVTKGASGNVMMPLQPDDPLFEAGAPNFMLLSRATNQPGPDGELGTPDDVHEHLNQTTPFVDQNQTYTSHPSHQVFLREYRLDADGEPVATGRLLDGANGGLATWAEVKAQARELLGIELTDANAIDVPLLATDPYGNFIPGPNGFPQLITLGPDGEKDTGDEGVVEGNPAAPASTADAVSAGHAFLDDISQMGNPAGKIADTDDVSGLSNIDGSSTADSFDDESLNAHFATGDGRGNENIALTAIHHVFHSEHNRVVGHIQEVITATNDPDFIAQWRLPDGTWDGERLFQAARFSTELQYQHLVFQEFARGRVQPDIDLFESHDPTIDASIVAEFAHTVYRFGHTMLNDSVPRMAPDGTPSDVPLIEAFLNPLEFTQSGATPEAAAGALVRGMANQTGNEMDEFITEAVRNNLLGLPLDLAALNLARARDTGIPSLNEVRSQFHEATGGDERLAPYENWSEFGAALRHPESLVNFIAAYGAHPTILEAQTLEEKRAAATAIVLGGEDAPADRVGFLNESASASGLDDVEFWIGGLAEKPLGSGLLGPTFGYVFETQLENLQAGDRFYYPHRTAGLNFFNQLQESSFAELIMRNTDVTDLSLDVFAAPGVNDPTIFGGDGADVLAGGTGNDSIVAGAGDDVITDSGGDDVLKGGDGNDRIESQGGADRILAGSGGDFIVGAGAKLILAGRGNDIVFAGDASQTVQGNEGDDWIEGGASDDFISGDNHDPLHRDFVAGNDVLVGGAGNDTLEGEHGDDIFLVGDGFDRILGMTGYDWASYELSPNGVTADLSHVAKPLAAGTPAPEATEDLFDGVEAISGSAFDDVLRGDAADNRLLGGAGSDRLEGGGGNDLLAGDSYLHVALSERAPGGEIVREILGSEPANDDVDTALYAEAAENYDVSGNADGSFTVAHARGSRSDGIDILYEMEQLQFADEVVALQDAGTAASTSTPPPTDFLLT